MYFKEEFIKIKEIGYTELEKEFKLIEENLNEKKYLFKTLNILDRLQDYLDNTIDKSIFEEVKYIQFVKEYDYDYGDNLTKFEFLDINKMEMSYLRHFYFPKELNIIKSLFEANLLLPNNFSNNNLIKDKIVAIPFDNDLPNKLKQYLLNDKFLSIISYNKLNEELPDFNTNNKKHKL